jgi:hypothetical protein
MREREPRCRGDLGSGLARSEGLEPPTFWSVGVGTTSGAVHRGLWAGPKFRDCPDVAGVVRRHGSSIGSSRGAAALILDRLLFRPGIPQVGADSASVVHCHWPLLVAGARRLRSCTTAVALALWCSSPSRCWCAERAIALPRPLPRTDCCRTLRQTGSAQGRRSRSRSDAGGALDGFRMA